MQIICDHYEAALRGEIRRLVVNIPPGFSKSLITNVFLPAYDWGPGECPGRKYIYTSYSDEVSLRDGRRCRDLVNSEWYQERWGAGTPHNLTIDKGERAAEGFFVNNSSGQRYATTMKGQVTGQHAHIRVCDDPIKPLDIQEGGESARELLDFVNRTWDQTFSNRSADPLNDVEILIMQRLHHLDLAGALLDRGYVGLILPMEFEPDRAYKSKWGSDWRKTAGEPLSQLRFPASVIAEKKRIHTPRDYEAQFQQRPSPEDGSMFLRAYFAQRWTQLPPGLSRWLISVDASLKEKKDSDYFVAQVWAQRGPAAFYLVDQMRDRVGFAGGVGIIKMLRNKWPNVKGCLIEDKANGTAIIQTLQGIMSGVVAVNPMGGKDARAGSVEYLYRAMNVWFPADEVAPWMPQFVNEHISFPVGAHDDSVDCATQALIEYSGKNRPRILKQAMENVRSGAAGRVFARGMHNFAGRRLI